MKNFSNGFVSISVKQLNVISVAVDMEAMTADNAFNREQVANEPECFCFFF